MNSRGKRWAMVLATGLLATGLLAAAACTQEQQNQIFLAELDKILGTTPTGTVSTVPAPVSWQEEAGFIRTHSGVVEISRPPSTAWVPVRDGMGIFTGDRLRSLANGSFELQRNSGLVVKAAADSLLAVPSKDRPIKGVAGYLEYLSGRFWMSLDALRQRGFEFHTPNAITSVKGTELEIVVRDGTTTVNTLQGVVEVSDRRRLKSQTVRAGESTTCTATGPSPAVRSPPDAMGQWWLPGAGPPPPRGLNPRLVQLGTTVLSAAALMAVFLLARAIRKRIKKRHPTP
jgi:hypothetical protein